MIGILADLRKLDFYRSASRETGSALSPAGARSSQPSSAPVRFALSATKSCQAASNVPERDDADTDAADTREARPSTCRAILRQDVVLHRRAGSPAIAAMNIPYAPDTASRGG